MDEEKCFEYLEEKQFKNGVHCLLRGGTLIREPKKYNGRYYCASCNHFFSLKKGIHFEHGPLLDNEIIFDIFMTSSIYG